MPIIIASTATSWSELRALLRRQKEALDDIARRQVEPAMSTMTSTEND